MLPKIGVIALLLIAVLLAGCSTGAEPTPVPELTDRDAAPEQVSPDAAYPEPGYPEPPVAQPSEAYPGVDALADQQATREALPTLTPLGDPAPGKGHLTGQIENERDGQTREPLAGWRLLLAQVHYDVSGNISPVASVVEGRAPEAVTDRDGRYAFADLEPGLYALVLSHPMSVSVARDVRTEQDVVVEILAGETTVEPLIIVSVSE